MTHRSQPQPLHGLLRGVLLPTQVPPPAPRYGSARPSPPQTRHIKSRHFGLIVGTTNTSVSSLAVGWRVAPLPQPRRVQARAQHGRPGGGGHGAVVRASRDKGRGGGCGARGLREE